MSDLNRAIDLIKRGQKDAARHLLISLLKENRHNEQGWLYLAACATSKSEFTHSIQETLKLNPYNQQALELAEKYDIALPEEVIAAKKSAKKQKKRREPSSGRSGGGLRRVLLLLILLIVAVGAAAFLLTRGGDEAETEALATQEATVEITAEATETEIEETEVATEAATQEATTESVATVEVTEEIAATEVVETEEAVQATPTRRPSNTPRPTEPPATEEAPTEEVEPTPTIRATATPEDEPTVAVPVGDAMLSLVYDQDSVYLINLTDENLDVSELRFVQESPTTPDDPIDFITTEWQNDNYQGAGSVYQIQPDSCFQIGVDVGSASTKPVDCVRLTQWQARREISQFWLKFEGGPDEFEVYQGETLVATCPLEAFSCDFAITTGE